MVDGEGGIPGLNVPRPVVKEHRREEENVLKSPLLSSYLRVFGIHVRVMLQRPELVTKINVSSFYIAPF